MQEHQTIPAAERPEAFRTLWAPACLVLAITLSFAAGPDAPSAGATVGITQFSGAWDPLISNYPAELRTTLSSFGKAVDLYTRGNFQSALTALPDDSAAAATALRDQIILLRAKTDLELDRAREALDLFRSVQSLQGEPQPARDAILGESRALLKLRDPAAALDVLDRAKLKDTAEVLFIRGQSLELEGKIAEAVQIYLRIYCGFVNSSQAAPAEQRLRLLAPTFQLKSENREILLQRGENLIRAGRSQAARALLLKLETLRLDDAQAQKLRILVADADTNINRPVEALRYLKKITDPALAEQALYLQGVCHRALKSEAAFLAARDRALREFPRSLFTEKLLYSVATYYDVRSEPIAAQEMYAAIVKGFPKGEYIERALWKVALYSYVQRRYREALNGFQQCLLANTNPGAAAASAYWMGRCCDHLGASETSA